VQHPLTRAVGFTGSREAGRALFNAAAARPVPIPVFAEMASLNPVFLLPGALRERAAAIAEGLKNSVTIGVGQFCTKPGLIFASEGEGLDQFRQALASLLASAAPATMLHRGICDAYHEGLAAAMATPEVTVLARTAAPSEPKPTQGEPVILETTVANFLRQPQLAEEVFGPFAILVVGKARADLLAAAGALEGQLTATIHGTPDELAEAAELVGLLNHKAGRLICNGFPTGVEVSHAMQHGGPYPATTDARFTSVGTAALFRFVRPVCYQNFPPALLPSELQDSNPSGLWRLVDGRRTNDSV
jgi:NADP-dependent aldehyde dehydrogenase